ncbi:phage antirepressor protein KilAC domain-containing protein [Elizabethkingia sp. YR214]|uniref:phage antirepressor KilAC domain-containing protein n=1 Tax=Elizabethkingia sp. YR214 TaxID=2135667 RepID=UPI000D4B2949|nr:phage antirepressor KilAC domain-containing protein [Elizabethkingia sp. YR214]PUB25847.1 phage antirepressor protein KilAC domain-containing protein [Elizabethkingia sp. YR214]
MYGYVDNEQKKEYYKMTEVAKKINIKNFGRIKIFKLLREKKILNENNHPKQEFIDQGYFKPIINTIHIAKNYSFGSSSCLVSEKGIEFIKTIIQINPKM